MSIERHFFEGVRFALFTPFLAVLAMAIGDFDTLRDYLTHTTGDEIQWVLTQFVIAGFLAGALSSLFIHRKHEALGHSSISGTLAGASGDLARWYWELGDGRDLSVREATTSRCIPNADTRWALDDLCKELSRLGAAGSELLDRKVKKVLGLRDQSLRPTQQLEDAITLLSLRYHGHSSKYQWDAKTEPKDSGFRAYVMVRESEVGEWRRCLTVDGPSAATAITIAALTRETWSFTT